MCHDPTLTVEKEKGTLKRSRLRPMSAKRKVENTTYKLHVEEWKRDRISRDGFWRCEFVSPTIRHELFGTIAAVRGYYSLPERRCVEHAVDVHHRKGRGKYLTYKRYFMGCCRFHHSWIEEHKREARKLGLILYK